jgi:hypothetical protein
MTLYLKSNRDKIADELNKILCRNNLTHCEESIIDLILSNIKIIDETLLIKLFGIINTFTFEMDVISQTEHPINNISCCGN